jgi:hypothetical protein
MHEELVRERGRRKKAGTVSKKKNGASEKRLKEYFKRNRERVGEILCQQQKRADESQAKYVEYAEAMNVSCAIANKEADCKRDERILNCARMYGYRRCVEVYGRYETERVCGADEKKWWLENSVPLPNGYRENKWGKSPKLSAKNGKGGFGEPPSSYGEDSLYDTLLVAGVLDLDGEWN